MNLLTEIEYFTLPELCERWHTTPSKLRRMIQEYELAAVRIEGVLKVPADFARGDEPLSSLRGTLLALNDAGFSEEEAVLWILSENDEIGESPISSLLAGKKSAVRRATQSLAF